MTNSTPLKLEYSLKAKAYKSHIWEINIKEGNLMLNWNIYIFGLNLIQKKYSKNAFFIKILNNFLVQPIADLNDNFIPNFFPVVSI